ncbi:intracellular short-chain-length polyhydroxyalkanoate depolymerase [Sutcliffiella cohnii]|uniref:Alpha/beta hydrolase n=1 Tax=Sutcliffiella cohnii TaxID=33932 RepID=A0A223KM45_9BACI|nr:MULTISPECIES: alpha/beta hydrolase [Sutcliffiella]AST90532.1 alpha/beta hydrolase [Sutcliffiella cohnii]MED4016814.1 alpha/beta hydrolase [Sutcliffiella cohnii]WBL16181.1 alpha/beta hydrolase [Sutcliffiella sp. NC1]
MNEVVMKSVKLPNGETIGYRERVGSGRTLLLVHGNMTSSKHWDVLLENMESDYHLVAIDMRGFGESTYHEKIYSIKDLAEDIKLFVDELQLSRFTIMGWSLGGAVSMQFVINYPQYCEQLILLASASTRGYPFFGTGEDGQIDIGKRLTSYDEIKVDPGRTIVMQTAYDTKNKELLKLVWNSVIYTTKQPDENKYDEYLDDMITQRNLAEIYHALNTFNISHQHNGLVEGTGEVSKINIPTLILWGENDLVVTETMTNELVEDFGDAATFVKLEKCGHSPLIDDLPKLIKEVTMFMTEEKVQ